MRRALLLPSSVSTRMVSPASSERASRTAVVVPPIAEVTAATSVRASVSRASVAPARSANVWSRVNALSSCACERGQQQTRGAARAREGNDKGIQDAAAACKPTGAEGERRV